MKIKALLALVMAVVLAPVFVNAEETKAADTEETKTEAGK